MTGGGNDRELAALRARLATLRGAAYWHALEELAERPGAAALLAQEFPRHAAGLLDPVDRRQFLRLMGASLALAGLGACSRAPTETIVPYVRPPEELVPGKPLFFATALSLGGFATGVLVESHMGRPTKVEGNPDHPASQGATDAFAQASVLTLYDPDRAQTITETGAIRPWGAFLAEVRRIVETEGPRKGAGLRVLTETVTSPTLAGQLRALLATFPAAKWHQYEPVGRDNARAGAHLAFGEVVEPRHQIENADVILALDADFLGCSPGNLRYARAFATRRRPRPGGPDMNRLYVVESAASTTGAVADHRLPLRASAIETFARALAAALGLGGHPPAEGNPARAHEIALFGAALVPDLERHRGRSVVIAGEPQPPAVHALAHAINHALGNVGETVVYTDPVEAEPVDQLASLHELVDDMAAGRVDNLLILGGNPAYTAPVDLAFAQSLAQVARRIHVSLYYDETSALCHWHVPAAHELETWSDTRAYDGTTSIVQPLIAPLYDGKSAHEVLATFTGEPERSSYDLVRAHWQRQHAGDDFERFWRRALHDGVVAGTALPPRSVVLQEAPVPPPAPSGTAGSLELVFRPDPTLFDGRFANNGWLQELPKPLTSLTWDNAALVSPATAERFGLTNEQVIELRSRGRTARAPVWIVPGQADDAVTLHLGHGRTRAGRVGTGVGFDAYGLRTADAPWFVTGLELHPTNERQPLACTRHHHDMAGRPIVRAASLVDYRAHPSFAQDEEPAPSSALTLYPPVPYPGYAWGMAIDLSACIGCNACVVACQAENNIPIVGKSEVIRGREMHWLRVDRYALGMAENPDNYFMPVPCMHCENAPCELVCPVEATVHSAEGLNDMVYNRCVGTRYCSNNCPYKVRRFNFFQYADWETPSLKLLRNPDVTVRSRGVMEKCTYCVQRINVSRITAEKEDRPIRDGEIVTACQAVCPTEAIVFGNINDPTSRVARLKADERNYALLGELNTRPRTTYLAAVRNPNPELA